MIVDGASVTPAEAREIGRALAHGRGGMVVVPFKGGRRLPPLLVPARPSGDPDERALEALRLKLRAMGCARAQGVGVAGRAFEIPLDAG